jgi:hypothetical protein
VAGDLRPDQTSDARTEDGRNASDFPARIGYMEPNHNDNTDQNAREASDDKRFHHARHASR